VPQKWDILILSKSLLKMAQTRRQPNIGIKHPYTLQQERDILKLSNIFSKMVQTFKLRQHWVRPLSTLQVKEIIKIFLGFSKKLINEENNQNIPNMN
jgi:hypothetical protein